MQHAIDSHLIASTIYEGYADPDPAGMSQNQMTGSPYYPIQLGAKSEGYVCLQSNIGEADVGYRRLSQRI